jgi:hypothetical protein
LLVFLVGTLAGALLDLWWAVLSGVVGLIAAAFLIHRASPVEPEPDSTGDSIIFL